MTKYQKRISCPLLDRIDIHIEVPRVDYDKLSSDRLGEHSSAIRARVQAARQRQLERFKGTDIICPVNKPGLSQYRYARGRSAEVLSRANSGTIANWMKPVIT